MPRRRVKTEREIGKIRHHSHYTRSTSQLNHTHQSTAMWKWMCEWERERESHTSSSSYSPFHSLAEQPNVSYTYYNIIFPVNKHCQGVLSLVSIGLLTLRNTLLTRGNKVNEKYTSRNFDNSKVWRDWWVTFLRVNKYRNVTLGKRFIPSLSLRSPSLPSTINNKSEGTESWLKQGLGWWFQKSYTSFKISSGENVITLQLLVWS